MNEFWASAGGCFLLGALTTIHPCPLTANVAAISMLAGWYGKTPRLWLVAVLFIAGYLVTFLAVSVLITTGTISIPGASHFMQRVMGVFFGPLLIFVGMIFAGLIRLNRFRYHIKFRPSEEGPGKVYYAFPMGVVIALSFCPATAAVFFGLLIPLAIDEGRVILFPLIYAAGLSLPLIIISLLIHRSGRLILNLKWQRQIPEFAGWIMILAGMLITVRQVIL